MEHAALYPSPPRLGLAWLAAGALLLTEYLFISLIFDAAAWMQVEGPLRVLGHLGEVATVGAVAVFATLLLRGRVLLEALHAQHRPQPLARRALWALLHLLSYPVLVYTTSRVFAVPDPERVTALGIALWLMSAAVSVTTLLLVLAPWPSLRALAPRVMPALGIGLLAGLTAFGFGQLSSALWGPMGEATLSAVHFLLVRFASDVHVDYATYTIGTESFSVIVAPVCSGFEGIGLIVVFLGGYMALNRKDIRFPRALWLLPLAVLTVWLANVARIVILILIGSHGAPQIALGGFHSKAGWVFFCMVALGFAAWLRSADAFRVRHASEAARVEDDDARATAAAYLLPELALLGTSLVTGLFVHDIDWFYGARIVAAVAAMWLLRARLAPLVQRPSLESVAIGVAVFVVWYALTEHQSEAGDHLRERVMALGQPLAALWIATRIIGSVLIVPIAEELAFRGYLLRRIISPDFDRVPFDKLTWPALVVSSLAFGLLHADWIAATLAGVAYAVAQRRRGKLADAATAHAVTNALVALDVLVLGAWAQW